MALSFADKEKAYMDSGYPVVPYGSITDQQFWYLKYVAVLPDYTGSIADILRNVYLVKPIVPYPLAP